MVDFSEVIDKNVEGVTQEQKTKLVRLFQNAISERVAEIHRGYDSDIEAATGNTKPQGVKTYEWMKTEFSALKGVAEKAAQSANEASQDKISQLEAQVEKAKKDGAGNARVIQLEKELADAAGVMGQLKEKHTSDLGGWETKYNDLQGKYKQSGIKQHLVGLKLRADIPESLQKMALNNAVAHVGGLTSEVDSQGNTIYRDTEGKLMTNPDNNLAPYTTLELLKKQLDDVIDKGRKQTGAGSQGSTKANGKGSPLVINASTQTEAMNQIIEHLFAAGIPQSDSRHQEMINTAWTENKVSEMPAQ